MQAVASPVQVRTGVLEGVRVVDLGRYRACAEAALLLAELGAEVVKIRLVQEQGCGLSAVQAAIWDRSKAVIDIDLGDAQERERVNQFIASADVVLQDRTPFEMKALGLDEASLCAGRNDLIFATIGSWPASHVNADRPVDDVLVLAEAGILDEQEAVGRDGPVFLGFPLGSTHAAFLSAIGVIARLIRRHESNVGGAVATSLLQGALLPMMMYWERAAKPTASVAKGMPKQTPQPLYECQDGKWMHVMGDPGRAPLVRSMLDEMGPENIRAANDRHYGQRPVVLPNLGAFAHIFRQRPRDVWLEELWRSDVPVQPVTETGALFYDEQARASGYVAEVATKAFGPTLQAAVPVQLTPPVRVKAGAEVPDWELRSSSAADASGAPAPRRPLEGMKVLDFGSYLAGPLAAMLLADLGADVIKVESLGGEPMRHVEWAFNACQRGKRTIALDLANPRAAEVIARLVREADVVHHNQRMPTARKLGIDYESLKKINPRLVYTHVSAYGPQGPRKDWPGYDQLFQAASGWEIEAAGEGNSPTWLRFGMMDHLAALASLFGTMGALYHRQQTGEGQQVAASLLGASLFTLDTAADAQGGLLPYPKVDRHQFGFSPTRRIYQCADGWLAVSSDGEDALSRVLAAAACNNLAALEAWLGSREIAAGIKLFAQAGIPSVKVALANKNAFFDDPQNRAAGLLAAYPHPVYEKLEQIGGLWDFGDLDLALETAPPVVGQHTREILSEIGLAPHEIDDLLRQGVVQAV